MKRLFNTRGESEIEPGDRVGRSIAQQKPQQPQQPQQLQQQAAQLKKPFVLYLKANDDNSSAAYRLAVPILNQIEVQDTRQLKEIPPFLKGVPTLLDIGKREAYPGRLCLQFLERMSERPVYDANSAVIPQDAYDVRSNEPGNDSGPGAQGLSADEGYAPCDFLPSDPSLYQSGRRNKEDANGIINRLMEERSGDAPIQSTGQLSPAEMSKIMQSMLEN